jgi:hypothetical protein
MKATSSSLKRLVSVQVMGTESRTYKLSKTTPPPSKHQYIAPSALEPDDGGGESDNGRSEVLGPLGEDVADEVQEKLPAKLPTDDPKEAREVPRDQRADSHALSVGCSTLLVGGSGRRGLWVGPNAVGTPEGRLLARGDGNSGSGLTDAGSTVDERRLEDAFPATSSRAFFLVGVPKA